jgi:hypothetical protein
MGISSDGVISYGLKFEEGYEFPWQGEDYTDWWLKESGYKEPFKLWDSNGNFPNGVKPADSVITEYYNHRREFKKEHPLPFEMVDYCSGEYPMYILAVPGTIITANRGHPIEFNPAELDCRILIHEKELRAFSNFCEKYLNNHDQRKWWLSSYMG